MSTTDNALPSIEIRENGSFLAKGVQSMVTQEGKSIETKEKFSLCRCGHSSNKPFCDATHKSIGFSGKRESDKELHLSKPYEGEEVTIEDNRRICAHAGYCVSNLPSVFKKEGRPWIEPDGADAETIASLTHRCPSGALKTFMEGKQIDRQDDPAKIIIKTDGPYEVRGGIHLEIDDELSPPEPLRYSLCRCGASKNKPYCDGSHGNLEKGWGRLASEENQ